MASENSTNTETIDSKAGVEQDETPAPEQEQEASAAATRAEDSAETTAESAAATKAEEPGTPASSSSGGFLVGAASVVSAGLALSSLSGTSLGEMLRSRQEIIGQIEASTGGGGDKIEAYYGSPWHTAALANGIVALIAVLIGGVVVLTYARRADARHWVVAVALGGVLLGLIGVLVASGMSLDLFAAPPQLPKFPGSGG